jgi:hypothetical protein
MRRTAFVPFALATLLALSGTGHLAAQQVARDGKKAAAPKSKGEPQRAVVASGSVQVATEPTKKGPPPPKAAQAPAVTKQSGSAVQAGSVQVASDAKKGAAPDKRAAAASDRVVLQAPATSAAGNKSGAAAPKPAASTERVAPTPKSRPKPR